MDTIPSLHFESTDLIEVPVTIGKDEFVLREADGDVSCKYRNAVLSCTKLSGRGKPVSIQNLADVEPYLVSLCLFSLDGKPVALKVVRSWPNRITKQLYNTAKEISNLDEGDDPRREQLEKALGLPGAPCTFEALAEFVEELDDDDFDELRRLFDTVGEKSKNSPEENSDGSS